MDKRMTAALLVGVVIVALIGVGWYAIPRVRYGTTPPPQARPAERTFSWKLTYTDSTEDGLPRSTVALITDGDVYDVGIHAGSCAPIEAKNLLPGEVSAVLCWWAGGGDELGVFKEGTTHVVKQGSQDEGTAESPGSRGNFKKLFVIQGS